jgi:hypothetical protein
LHSPAALCARSVELSSHLVALFVQVVGTLLCRIHRLVRRCRQRLHLRRERLLDLGYSGSGSRSVCIGSNNVGISLSKKRMQLLFNRAECI